MADQVAATVASGDGDASTGRRRPDELRAAVWSRVQLARNVERPHTLELIRAMATDVVELHGDRLFRDDPAIVGGFCRIDGRRAVFVGHQKGAEIDENIRRNFGMPHPEGYRKAMRLYQLAERLRLPVVTFVDTPGAFPGPASEERGVAEAIARSIAVMTGLRTPIVTVITGEGGSGGALALAVGDVVLALENAIYSVISPEGAASILWRDRRVRAAGGGGDAPDRGEQLALRRDRRSRARAGRRRARASRRDREAPARDGSSPTSTRSPGAIARRWSRRATRATGGMGEFATVTAGRRGAAAAGRLGGSHPRAARERPRRDPRPRRRARRCRPIRRSTMPSCRCGEDV